MTDKDDGFYWNQGFRAGMVTGIIMAILIGVFLTLGQVLRP